ncbi:hypothetical protein SCHPADRAFT_193353 [Schizopora paradoxa]|uniref:Uncharacterized protein n=1 Tax=Schizopora paradoxa TaxID=27342 RepID=A0A0H2S552_9AGAM|nr:hypothetical protein SCHPADRAFT_193353 [Schizopora paradoxa]
MPSFYLFDPFENPENAFTMQEDNEPEILSLPPMCKSSFSKFFKFQGTPSSQFDITAAFLVGWKLKKLGAARQRKTFGLSLFNVQALRQRDDNDGSVSSPSSDATAVDQHFPRNTGAATLVNFHWSPIHFDQDYVNTFNNFATDFTGDFAVTTSVRTTAATRTPDAVSILIFGNKKSYAWSPAITINAVAQVNIKGDELVAAVGEYR